MDQILRHLIERFGPAAMGEWLARLLPRLITATIVLLVFYLIWKLLDRGFRLIRRKVDLDPTVATFIGTAIRYVMFTIAALTALAELGINTASFLASLGIAGLTLGFAAKDTLSNVISGLFIFWDRPFVVGDLIEMGGTYGRVEDITLRSTRVVTPDGKMLAIPNAAIVNSTVASYTNFPHLRLEIELTVGVGEDLNKIRDIFLGMVTEDARFMKEPGAEMVVTAINDYNVAVQFRVWLADEKQHIPERFELRERIFEAMRQAGVEMPYETFQLAPFEVKRLPAHAG
jgi:small conductance mechanosensitive channel